jgi:hypothetical protein
MQAFSDTANVGHFIHGQRVNCSGTHNQVCDADPEVSRI